MNSRLIRHKETKEVYEVQYVVFPKTTAPANMSDVYAAYRLSAYDGMPIGPRVWVTACDFEPADIERVKGITLDLVDADCEPTDPYKR